MPFLQKGIIRVGNPKQKMAKEKFVVKKPPSRPFPHTCVVPLRERELERRETRDSERDTHADTHTHTHTEREFLKRESERETVCYCAFCERDKRERERLTLFSFAV